MKTYAHISEIVPQDWHLDGPWRGSSCPYADQTNALLEYRYHQTRSCIFYAHTKVGTNLVELATFWWYHFSFPSQTVQVDFRSSSHKKLERQLSLYFQSCHLCLPKLHLGMTIPPQSHLSLTSSSTDKYHQRNSQTHLWMQNNVALNFTGQVSSHLVFCHRNPILFDLIIVEMPSSKVNIIDYSLVIYWASDSCVRFHRTFGINLLFDCWITIGFILFIIKLKNYNGV